MTMHGTVSHYSYDNLLIKNWYSVKCHDYIFISILFILLYYYILGQGAKYKLILLQISLTRDLTFITTHY